ncbi:MAG TPA: YciI family protein [Candidatus Polarisedimenticolaceae bacterium]|nr:YciI family protein [Candidatus Polarisedimenticolaceae bacterium]
MPLWVRTVLVTGPEAEAAEARRDHVEHLRRLAAAGKLRAAGEFAKGEGFLEIFEADDLHEAEEIARESPLVILGLGTWMLRRWEELDFGDSNRIS